VNVLLSLHLAWKKATNISEKELFLSHKLSSVVGRLKLSCSHYEEFVFVVLAFQGCLSSLFREEEQKTENEENVCFESGRYACGKLV